MSGHCRQVAFLAALVCSVVVAVQRAIGGEELANLIEKTEPYVVFIKTNRAQGSGILIDDKQTVVTNFHVVEGAVEATVRFSDRTMYRVLGYVAADPGHDLALLRIEGANSNKGAVPIARNLPRKGDRVVALGSPQGLEFSGSEGIVSALRTGRDIQAMWPGVNEALGYEVDAAWIQTTAAISPGNSGGPLINAAGEIVGLNTFHRPDGQNLNFAISAPEIHRIVSKAKQDYKLLSTLRRPGQRLSIVREDLGRIIFPSGNVLSDKIFETDIASVIQSELKAPSVAQLLYADGSWYAMAAHKNGVLHGISIVRHETDDPALYATYLEGRRHGILKTWDVEGHRTYWCQYFKGKRNGFCCLYSDDALRLVAECKMDRMQQIHLMAAGKVVQTFSSEAEAKKVDDAQKQLARLTEIETKLKKQEREFKKQITADEERTRRERVAVLNPEKRARGQERINQRRAAKAEFNRRVGTGR